jgi:tetratricopeptide (TPR) repeat protein
VSKRKKKTQRRRPGRRRGWRVSRPQIEIWLTEVEDQIRAGKYEDVIKTTQHILSNVPENSTPYADALEYLGTAQLMLPDHYAAYETLSRALKLRPQSAHLWYNRGIVARYVMRLGQSVRDLERAIALEKNPDLRKQFKEELVFSRTMAESEMALRGPDFSLEQLIEQQEIYQQAVKLMAKARWAEAEKLLRQAIAMGDCLPQPWGNLGGCLMQQERYDEAEAALRRALEVDPKYKIAKQNLKQLPRIRRLGPPEVAITHPFEGKKIKQSLTFFEE